MMYFSVYLSIIYDLSIYFSIYNNKSKRGHQFKREMGCRGHGRFGGKGNMEGVGGKGKREYDHYILILKYTLNFYRYFKTKRNMPKKRSILNAASFLQVYC